MKQHLLVFVSKLPAHAETWELLEFMGDHSHVSDAFKVEARDGKWYLMYHFFHNTNEAAEAYADSYELDFDNELEVVYL